MRTTSRDQAIGGLVECEYRRHRDEKTWGGPGFWLQRLDLNDDPSANSSGPSASESMNFQAVIKIGNEKSACRK
jgi:hypothetical protein